MQLLTNKWALVTGSSRGIGQQIALGLAQHQCNLIIHGRKESSLEETKKLLGEYPIQVRTIWGDLGEAVGVQSVINGVQANPGYVDIIYNNAAIQNEYKPIWKISLEEWQHTFQVNLWAMIQLCNAFAPGMKAREYGRIILRAWARI